jgi:hypothetical protein
MVWVKAQLAVESKSHDTGSSCCTWEAAARIGNKHDRMHLYSDMRTATAVENTQVDVGYALTSVRHEANETNIPAGPAQTTLGALPPNSI